MYHRSNILCWKCWSKRAEEIRGRYFSPNPWQGLHEFDKRANPSVTDIRIHRSHRSLFKLKAEVLIDCEKRAILTACESGCRKMPSLCCRSSGRLSLIPSDPLSYGKRWPSQTWPHIQDWSECPEVNTFPYTKIWARISWCNCCLILSSSSSWRRRFPDAHPYHTLLHLILSFDCIWYPLTSRWPEEGENFSHRLIISAKSRGRWPGNGDKAVLWMNPSLRSDAACNRYLRQCVISARTQTRKTLDNRRLWCMFKQEKRDAKVRFRVVNEETKQANKQTLDTGNRVQNMGTFLASHSFSILISFWFIRMNHPMQKQQTSTCNSGEVSWSLRRKGYEIHDTRRASDAEKWFRCALAAPAFVCFLFRCR